VGRVAAKIIDKLRGKDRVDFLSNLDLGNYVVLTNAQYVSFSGKKMKSKHYYNHSGYPGGMRKRSLEIMFKNYPTELARRIIKGMAPHTKLARKQLKRLFIYPNDSHPHQAQQKNFIKI
jgi:large subunit ribosomal protein L13